MNKDRLLKYCEENRISVFKNASIHHIRAAIVRAFLHQREIEQPESCFGLWDDEAIACRQCGVEKKCFEISLGMDKDAYEKKLKNLENGRLSFVGTMSRSKKKTRL